jgi:hypothetical protein
MQLLDNKASIYSSVVRYVSNEIAHRKKKWTKNITVIHTFFFIFYMLRTP